MKKFNPADNLKKRGSQANPNGRPKKGYSITEMMKSMLGADPKLKKSIGKTIAQKALEGDMAAIKLLWQYMDGMPKQEVAISDPSSILDQLEKEATDYEEFSQQARLALEEQVVEDDPPVQDQGQDGGGADVQAEPGAAQTHS